MAMSTSRRMLAGLVAGMLARPSAHVLCEHGVTSESCRTVQHAQDHVLLQRNKTSKARSGRCSFAATPSTPYYWDPDCSLGMVGCRADGVHTECRFCDYEYIPCPETASWPMDVCNFSHAPLATDVGYYYDKACVEAGGGLGCNADGQHMGCRFCGGGPYAEVPCKVDRCTFENEPGRPYYHDHSCEMGMPGCMADGVHVGCRFCGMRPYENVPCPVSVALPQRCMFENEPTMKYYWDENCTEGMLGCLADGFHAKCRFCGGEPGSTYAEVTCP